jgi:hypothetical protein
VLAVLKVWFLRPEMYLNSETDFTKIGYVDGNWMDLSQGSVH